MKHEKSCGAVVFTRVDGEIRYLLIKSLTGTYGFPKGHVEAGETEIQTARREIFEEVGLSVELLSGFRREDKYRIYKNGNVLKRVVYFLGEYSDQTVICQEEEIADALLLDYDSAMSLLKFDGIKRILTKANDFLKGI